MSQEMDAAIALPPGITDRGLFLKAAVETLLIQVDEATLCAIVAGGKQEFARVAREKWQGHGFDDGDFGKAYELLKAESDKRPQLLIDNG